MFRADSIIKQFEDNEQVLINNLYREQKDYINQLLDTPKAQTDKLNDAEYACWLMFTEHPNSTEITEEEYQQEVKFIAMDSGMSSANVYALFNFKKRNGLYIVSRKQINIQVLKTFNEKS